MDATARKKIEAEGESFNLRDVVRDVCTSSRETSTDALADLVLRRIGPAAYREALSECLPEYVRHFLTQQRFTPEREDEDHGPAPQPGRSWKVEGLRDLCEQRIPLGDGTMKFLGDCTRDDLAKVIEIRREQARRCEAKADFYEGLRRALARHRVEKVRELPEDVRARLFAKGEL